MNQNNKKPNWRKRFFNWHLWSGLGFCIPIFLVALTAILIEHGSDLGTRKITVNAGWFPGYSDKENAEHFLNDVNDVATNNKTDYFATRLGLIVHKDDKIVIVKNTEGVEVRDIETVNGTIWIATKKGIFTVDTTHIAKSLLKGEFFSINHSSQKWVAIGGKDGIQISANNGVSWQKSSLSDIVGKEKTEKLLTSISGASYLNEVMLNKIILDIHSGKAFFGRGAMWIWVDLIAVSLFFMIFTGIWMWYKRTYGKKSKKNITPLNS